MQYCVIWTFGNHLTGYYCSFNTGVIPGNIKEIKYKYMQLRVEHSNYPEAIMFYCSFMVLELFLMAGEIREFLPSD